jgi:hypothetical protein
LLIGREDLRDNEIKNNKIGSDEIKDNEENIEIINCEKFFLNYINRWAVSLYFANLIVNRAAIETANTY